MAVVDLSRRLTSDMAAQKRAETSPDSLVYVGGPNLFRPEEPATLDLSVANERFDLPSGPRREVSEKGFTLRPKQYVAFPTAQHLRLPTNMFGMVTGRGRYIYRGLVLSPCKIDPGFDGPLTLAFFNAGNDDVHIQPGDAICSAVFFEADLPVDAVSSRHTPTPPALPDKASKRQRFTAFMRRNWAQVASLAISVVAVVVAFATAGK